MLFLKTNFKKLYLFYLLLNALKYTFKPQGKFTKAAINIKCDNKS